MFALDYAKKSQEISNWIAKTVHEAGFADVVVAVSGGVDSALALALAIQALGKEHVYTMRLPYGKMSTKATEDAKLLTRAFGLPKEHVLQKDIYKAVNKILKHVENDTEDEVSDIRKGNIMARVRMVFLYDVAKSVNALVLGTENKSEYFLGYFTRFGDEASDIEPIRSLYKTQVWEMAKYLGVPDEIVKKAPTAGLWEGQTDEKEFGFSYKEADSILYHHFEEGLPEEAIIALGFEKDVVERVLTRVQANDFKHHLPKVF